MGNPLKTRFGGLFLTIIGVLAGWYFIYRPLEEAKRHVPSLDLSTKGAAVAPILIIMGIALMVFGDAAKDFWYVPGAAKKQLTPIGWVGVAVFAVIGIGVYLWLQNQLKGYGYAV